MKQLPWLRSTLLATARTLAPGKFYFSLHQDVRRELMALAATGIVNDLVLWAFLDPDQLVTYPEVIAMNINQ